MANLNESFATDYEVVAPSATDQVLGSTGEVGDFLDRLVIQVATAATAAVTLKDGGNTIFSFANSPGGGIGVYPVTFNVKAKAGPFKVTTGAGVTVLAVGKFV